MAKLSLNNAVHRLIAANGDQTGVSDGELLTCFANGGDATALGALVRRHASMVWGVCRRHLAHQQDVEDAFQATFLVLVRKAASVSPPDAVGKWLHGVARMTALRARNAIAKKARREQQVDLLPEPPLAPTHDTDLRPVIDVELALLPEKYRVVVELCDLQSLSRSHAAQKLGLPEGTIASRLTRARALLGKRLIRRGIRTAGGAVTVCVPTPLMASTIHLASMAQMAGVVPATVTHLTNKVLFTMTMKKIATAVSLPLVVLAVSLGGLAMAQPNSKGEKAKTAEASKTPVVKTDKNSVLNVIRLGVTRDVIIRDCGQPAEKETFVTGIESLHYQHGDNFRVFVEVDPKSGKAIQIFYKKKTPFTAIQVAELLERNAEGSKWWPVSVTDENSEYRSLDGGFARGGSAKYGDEYQFAILSGSEVRGRHPNLDAAREKARESLKEIK